MRQKPQNNSVENICKFNFALNHCGLIDVKRFLAAIKGKLPHKKNFQYANCAANNESSKTHCFVVVLM